MLSPTDLRAAMADAVKTANVCTRFCRTGIEPAESGLHVHHNSLGPSDSADVHVYAKHVLEANAEKLALILADWISALHKRQQGYDLNEAPK